MATKNAPNITKRQHYVQRAYLSAWTHNNTTAGKLFCFMKSGKISIESNIKNLAQERYFYEFKRLTELEKLMVGVMCTSKSKVLMDNNPYHLLSLNFAIWDMEDSAKHSGDTALIEGIGKLKKQFGEEVQCLYEKGGVDFLDKLKRGDGSFFLDDDSRLDFFHYIMMQYVRTSAMKNKYARQFKGIQEHQDRIPNLLNNIKAQLALEKITLNAATIKENLLDINSHLDFNKIYLYLLPNICHELAFAFSETNKMKLELLTPPPEYRFITGDQPIINLKVNVNDQFADVPGLEFYYPISPIKAIRLTIHHERVVHTTTLSPHEVSVLNKAIYSHAKNQVYAANECDLEVFKIIIKAQKTSGLTKEQWEINGVRST